jgi:hypothetical protein
MCGRGDSNPHGFVLSNPLSDQTFPLLVELMRMLRDSEKRA